MGNDKQSARYLICQVDELTFGIDITTIYKIQPIAELSDVSTHLDYLVGLLNLHGETVPVFDLLTYIGRVRTEPYTVDTAMIICNHYEKKMAFTVDKIHQIITTTEIEAHSEINVANSTEANMNQDIYKGTIIYEDKIVAVLSMENVFVKQLELTSL